MKEQKLAAVQAEIAAERANALGLSERRLKGTIAALRRFDEGQGVWRSRAQLLDDAAEACLAYVVQREAMGIGFREFQLLRAECGIPDEVWNRMGATVPR